MKKKLREKQKDTIENNNNTTEKREKEKETMKRVIKKRDRIGFVQSWEKINKQRRKMNAWEKILQIGMENEFLLKKFVVIVFNSILNSG